jgi:hypothetical protein
MKNYNVRHLTHQAKVVMLTSQTSALKALQIRGTPSQSLQWTCLVNSQIALASGGAI